MCTLEPETKAEPLDSDKLLRIIMKPTHPSQIRINPMRALGLLLVMTFAAKSAAWAGDLRTQPSRAIPDALVYADPAGPEHGQGTYAVIVDKRRQQLSLYGHDGTWKNIGRWPCSTGRKTGPKLREGDQKTPEGVYFALRDVGRRFLTDTYGARALPLDYPNWWDRSRQRSGSAIWLHGTNKPLQDRDSNGCVVINNDTINQLARYIHLNRTPVIIVEEARLWSLKDARKTAKTILSAAGRWHRALMHGSYRQFSRWYTSESKPSMAWWQKWCRQRKKHRNDHAFSSSLQQRAIYRSNGYFLLLFDHHLMADGRHTWAGRRKLFLRFEENKVAIIGEAFQSGPGVATDPLFHAWRKLWQKDSQRCKIAITQQNENNI